MNYYNQAMPMNVLGNYAVREIGDIILLTEEEKSIRELLPKLRDPKELADLFERAECLCKDVNILATSPELEDYRNRCRILVRKIENRAMQIGKYEEFTEELGRRYC